LISDIILFFLRTERRRHLGAIEDLERNYNFSFVIPDKLAGMSRPDRDALELLKEIGITGILSLTETPIPFPVLDGLDYCHLPVEDFTAPDMETFEHAIRFIDFVKGPAVVHCFAGIGRTGTVLAGYLIAGGMSASEAIRRIRELRPHSIENTAQETALFEYEAYRGEKERKPK